MDLRTIKQRVAIFLETTPYSLYEVELIKAKKETTLRIYIDALRQITLNDCVEATKLLNPFIDELDPIEGEYILEVSSPGAEKELRSKEQIENALGRYVFVKTYEQSLEGELKSFDGKTITLMIKNKLVNIDYLDVNLIRLAIRF